MDTLFLITARGGSKGIPGKNIKLLDSKPLIYYSIDVARKFVADEMICVSTDDNKIIDVVESYNLKVPFIRPAELATDHAGSYNVIIHALEYYRQKYPIEKVVLLQPTSPFRLVKHVKEAMESYSKSMDAVMSVKLTHSNPYQLLYIENEYGFLQKVIKDANFERRQDLPPVFEINGGIYIYNAESLLRSKIGDFTKIKHYVMPELNSVDIDTPLDWTWAEFLLEKKIIKLDH
jgi:CMP-N,N'-diacetyllegionaminic acid synthase